MRIRLRAVDKTNPARGKANLLVNAGRTAWNTVAAPSSAPTEHMISHLQRRYGNRFVQRVVDRSWQSEAGNGEMRLLQKNEASSSSQPGFQLHLPPLRIASDTGSGTRHAIVYFDQGAYIFPRFGELEKIERVAQTLLADPSLRVLLEGHASTEGSTADNERLALNRANAVKTLLNTQGVDNARMDTRGFGESQPAVEETAEAGRELENQRRQNRRVEVFIVPGLRSTVQQGGAQPQAQPSPIRIWPTPEELSRILTETEAERLNRRVREILQTPAPSQPQGRTFNEMFWDAVDNSLVNPMLNGFGIRSPKLREMIRDGVHAGINRGIEAGLDAAMDAANLSDGVQEAIRTTVRALRDLRPGRAPESPAGSRP